MMMMMMVAGYQRFGKTIDAYMDVVVGTSTGTRGYYVVPPAAHMLAQNKCRLST